MLLQATTETSHARQTGVVYVKTQQKIEPMKIHNKKNIYNMCVEEIYRVIFLQYNLDELPVCLFYTHSINIFVQ